MEQQYQSQNKLLVRNTIINYVRLILTSIVGLFGSRLIINGLGMQDYGLYNVVGGIVVFMSFLNTVMISTTYRFLAVEIGKGLMGEVNKIFNISMVIHLLMAILLILLTEIIGVYYVKNHLVVPDGKLGDALFVLRLSTYSTFFTILSIPYQGLMTAVENFTAMAIIDMAKSLLAFIAALIVAYYIGNRLRLYAILVSLASIVPVLFYYFYCKRTYADIVRWKFQKQREEYKEMLSFSGWTMFGAAANVGQSTGANLMINSFFGTVANAAFGIANQVNGIVLTFSNNLGRAALPQIAKNFSGNNQERAFNLTIYVSKFTFFLMFLISMPMLLETKFLLLLWLGQIPPYTEAFCQLLLAYALINSLNSGLPTLIQATGKIKLFQIFISSVSLLSLPAAYILFTMGYEPTTIVILTIIALIINLFIAQALLVRIIKFDSKTFFLRCYLPVIYVSLSTIPAFIIRDCFDFGLQRFIFITVFSVVSFLIAVFFLGIEKQQQTLLKNYVIGLRNKALK